MERRVISQILNRLNIELDSEVEKSLIDSILNAHHEEVDAEKERADEANTTLAELQKSYDAAIKNSESLDALKSEITSLKSQNKQAIADIEAKYQGKLLDNAIELALTQAGAKNNKAAAALLDKTNLKLSEDGSVFGLSEMIESVKANESTSFLFNTPEPEVKEEKKVYNYVPQGDAVEAKPDPVDKLFEATSHNSNSQIQGW